MISLMECKTSKSTYENVDLRNRTRNSVGLFHLMSPPPPPYGQIVLNCDSKVVSEGLSLSAPFDLCNFLNGMASLLLSEVNINFITFF